MNHDWIVTAIAGPLLVLFGSGAGLAMIRTRINAQRIKALEVALDKLEPLPKEVAKLRTTVDDRMRQERIASNRNDEDHKEIKQSMKENRAEVLEAVRQLKTDLVREFRNGRTRE